MYNMYIWNVYHLFIILLSGMGYLAAVAFMVSTRAEMQHSFATTALVPWAAMALLYLLIWYVMLWLAWKRGTKLRTITNAILPPLVLLVVLTGYNAFSQPLVSADLAAVAIIPWTRRQLFFAVLFTTLLFPPMIYSLERWVFSQKYVSKRLLHLLLVTLGIFLLLVLPLWINDALTGNLAFFLGIDAP